MSNHASPRRRLTQYSSSNSLPCIDDDHRQHPTSGRPRARRSVAHSDAASFGPLPRTASQKSKRRETPPGSPRRHARLRRVSSSSGTHTTNHHHHYSSTTRYGGTTLPTDAPPSLGALLTTMGHVLRLYWIHHTRPLRSSCRKLGTTLGYGIGTLALLLALWGLLLGGEFYFEAVRMCSVPSNAAAAAKRPTTYHTMPHEIENHPARPLVEYYVHGRGKGHSARTLAIVQDLNDAGVDVRMFIGRAAIWDFAPFLPTNPMTGTNATTTATTATANIGTTTAIAVTSIMPSLSVMNAISPMLERIMGDCEVARQKQRYPMLVVSDGDMPGMLRARLGGIPSVGISHGQTFSISEKPAWVKPSGGLVDKAWERQKLVNRVAAWFSSWQIGVNFVPLETSLSSAALARPPLRQQVLQMRASRANLLPLVESDETKRRMYRILRDGVDADEKERSNATNVEMKENLTFRKLVLCYFRDHDGLAVANVLLDAGFDVILLDSGFHAMFSGKKDAHQYGSKWIVNEKDRVRLRREAKMEPTDTVGATTDGTAASKSRPLSPKRRLARSTTTASNEPRLIQILDHSLFLPFMSIADGIAASAGCQLMSECIYANIPLLALHKTQDTEQLLNVEMSRRSRTSTHPDLAVFGASVDHFHEAQTSHETASSSSTPFHLRSSSSSSNNNSSSSSTVTSKRLRHHQQHHLSAGAKVAQTELEQFLAKVQASPVSEHYRRRLLRPTNDTNIAALSSDADDDPFRGMLDASAILLEIIKQQQQQQQQQKGDMHSTT